MKTSLNAHDISHLKPVRTQMLTAEQRKFPLGQVVATPNALAALDYGDMLLSLARHVLGDWGEVCDDDWTANEQALRLHLRLFSVYKDGKGNKFWIITEHDRSATTILLPSDY